MRRAFKIIGWTLGGLLLMTVLLCTAVFVAGNSGWGRAVIESTTARLTAGSVKLSGLAGSFPRALTLETLQLSDERGIWLTAEHVAVRWTPSALLARRLQIDSVQAARVRMERLPAKSTAAADTPPPSIPHIDAAQVSIDELELGPQLRLVPASLVLRGAVHLRSLTDMLIDVDSHRIGGDGVYALHLKFDPKRMDATLRLNEPGGGPLENLLQLPGLGALAVTVNLSGLRTAERLDLAVDAGPLRGTARGNVNVDELSGDVEVAIQSGAMNPRPEFKWDSAALTGRWRGSIKAPTADGHLDVEKLQLPGGTQMAALHADVTAGRGEAVLAAQVGGLRIPGPRPGLLQAAPVMLNATLHLNEPGRPLDVDASHNLFALKAHAETAAAAGRRNVTAELRLLDLTPLAALAGQKVGGTALLRAQLQDQPRVIRLKLDAGAALLGATESWSAAVGSRPTLEASGTVTGTTVTLESLKFLGRALSLTASGSASRPAAASGPQAGWTVRVPWSLSATDLAAWSPALAGTATASGLLEGPLTSMNGTAQLSTALSVRGTPTGVVTAAVRLRGLPAAPSGTIVAQGSLDEAPLDIDVELQRGPGGSLRALLRRAAWKSAHADGDVTMAHDFAQTHGQLHLKMAELKDLQAVLGIDVAGSLAGTAELHAAGGRTRAELRIEAPDVTIGQLSGSVSAAGEGFTDALRVKLDIKIPDLDGAAASLAGAGSLDLESRTLSLTDAAANYHGQDVRLLSPARIAFADGLSVDDLRLGAGQALFHLKGRISPTLDLHASLRQVEPSLVNVFRPGLMTAGTIEGHARLQGSLAAPTGEVRLTASGVSMGGDATLGLPPIELQAGAQLMGDTADIDARLSAGSASHLSVAGRAALTAGGAQELKIKGNLDVGMLNALIEGSGQHAAGQLSIDATVTGSLSDPQIGGTVVLKQGSFTDYGRGISVTNVAADIVGGEGKLQIKSFTASAAPGTLSMQGSVGILQSGLPVDLQITAKNAQPIASKMITTNFDADVHVSGTARERLDVAGTVSLHHTVIGVARNLPANVAVLDVRRRGKQVAAARRKELVIGLDMKLQAPREILVQGRGLDAELGGELQITGTTDAPLVSGGFDLQRGNFSLASARLEFIQPGRVSFDGAGLKNKIVPTLNFTAQSTTGDTTVSVHIFGYADAPQFELTSSPTLPPDEIMARLMFGENASQLSTLQLAQIGAALASISGVGGEGGLNPLVKIQESLGLDRLSVSAATGTTSTGTANTGASIEAGRYVSSRVYVEAKQSTTGTSQVEADIILTKRLKLQTKLGNGVATQGTTPENDPGSSIGLSYQFEY
jgi:translocation and assembly module TamB